MAARPKKKRAASPVRVVVKPLRPTQQRQPKPRQEIIVVNVPKDKEMKPKKNTRRKNKSVKRRVKKTVKRTYRRMSKKIKSTARRSYAMISRNSGGIITSNKKESLINLGCIGAGFIGSMALLNLAPIPSQIKNAKWKGGALAAITILLAVKVKDKKAKLALAGAAVYGLVDVLRNYIPQLSALHGYDAQRAMILSGAVESRARMAVGGTHGRTTAVGSAQTANVNANRARVLASSTYADSQGSFTTRSY